jgi:energy-coupling factor transporter ATP-binding protein EcfA2
MQPDQAAARQTASTARALRNELATLTLPLDLPGAPEARADAAAMVRQLDDHVLPRLENLDAPALVVIGGSTGSGKSTLVNSLIGTEVSKPGVLRPTTTHPVLVHHPDAAEWFGSGRVLSGHRDLQSVASTSVPAGIALLDAPDFDSVSDENRAMAAQLLDAADLWVFVTTAARYADAVPWGFLQQAARRGTSLVVVLNRVPPGSGPEVADHFATMLTENGLDGTQLFVIDEQPLTDGRLPASVLTGIRSWIDRLGTDKSARAEAVLRSLRGAVADIGRRTDALADAARLQSDTVEALRAMAHAPYVAAQTRVQDQISQGAMLKGEVLDRWEEVIGTGEMMRQVRTGLGRLRDTVAGALTGRQSGNAKLNGAVEHVAESLIHAHADSAAAEAVQAWRTHPAGAALLDRTDTDLARSSATLIPSSATAVRAWQSHVLDVVREAGAAKRTTARALSLGVNGAAIGVMMVAFAHTGGITGAEVAVAGGAGAVGHTVLEALLGDQAIRTLATEARDDLNRRVTVLYDSEAARFDAALAGLAVAVDAPSRLSALARQLGAQS